MKLTKEIVRKSIKNILNALPEDSEEASQDLQLEDVHELILKEFLLPDHLKDVILGWYNDSTEMADCLSRNELIGGVMELERMLNFAIEVKEIL